MLKNGLVKNVTKLSLTILLVIASYSVATAPLVKLQFQPYSLPNTSTLIKISSIYQDKRGVIWLGSEDGLIKYNGHEIQLFSSNINDEKTLSSNKITAIDEGRDSTIWVATSNGLNRLDGSTKAFSHYLKRPKSSSGYVNNFVYDVMADSQGRIWAATASGLFLYDEVKDSFKAYRPWHTKFAHDNLEIWAQSLFEDNGGIIWLGTSAGGLIRFDPTNENFVHYSSHPNNTNQFPSDFITSINALSNEVLLVGTDTGLFQFNIKTNNSQPVFQSVINKRVTGIHKSPDDDWWVLTETSLIKLSADLAKLEYYSPEGKENYNTTDSFPTSLLIDRENNIWTSFREDGLHFLSAEANTIRTVQLDNEDYINNFTKINAAIETNSQLIVSTSNLLSIVDNSVSNQVVNVFKKQTSNQFGEFYGIDSIDGNKIYVGRYGGLSVIVNNKKISHYNTGIALATQQVLLDFKGQVWIRIEGRGVQAFEAEQQNKLFKTLEQRMLGDYKSTAVSMQMSPDRKHLFILYSNKGLYHFNIETNSLNYINGTESIESYTSLQKTKQGLYLFNNELNARLLSFQDYNVDFLSLPTTKINCLVEDEDDNIWLAQLNGKLFQRSGNTSPLIEMRRNQGIPSKGLTGHLCKKLGNNALVFGSYQGLLYLSPSRQIKSTIEVNTHINRLQFGQQTQTIVTDIYALDAYGFAPPIETIYLKYNDAPLTISYSSLTFQDIKNHKFKYRLSGIDEKWTETDAYNISLASLPAGSFTFELFSGNSIGEWSASPAKLKFVVSPPFWLTWWAKTGYLILVLSLIAIAFYFKTINIRKRAHELEEKVKLRTVELAKEKETVEKLLAQKNDEFANISHEFRTPLTLILGPIKNLLRSNLRSTTRQKLEMVKRNGYRLLRMVDQLLHMEKFRVQHIINDRPIEIRQIVILIAQSFEDLAKEKGISFKLGEVADVKIKFTLDAFEKIILNLLSNALKYTPPGGWISLSISKTENGLISIEVADSGLGIAKEQQSSIFERFNRVLDENSEKITGAGIGLALVKELVESHQGNIYLDSELGKGSKFTVQLLPFIGEQHQEIPFTFNQEMLELELESIRGQEVNQKTVSDTQVENTEHSTNYDEQTKTTILVIEDNSDMRDYIVESIDDKYHCIQASNGKLGVVEAMNAIPDLVVSDVMMPEMNGYEVCQTLKSDEKTSHIPLILLTARGDKQSKMRGWQEHADEYLTKPFDSDELNIRIENLLSIRNMLRSRFAKDSIEQQSPKQQQRAGLSEKDSAFIQKVNQICEIHFTNADFETAEIAKAVFMSERQFQRKLKALLDQSPTDFLRNYRLNKSKISLSQGGRISDIALEVGFSSQAYFSKCFKAKYGMTAKAYQTSMLNQSIDQKQLTAKIG